MRALGRRVGCTPIGYETSRGHRHHGRVGRRRPRHGSTLRATRGKTGFASQQYDGPPEHPDRYNLWQPQDQERDAGAHGNFGKRSTGRSLQLWLSMHRTGLAAFGLTALTTVAAAFMARRR